MQTNTLTFKIASEEWEFEQIHRLNYKTFVEEIPQHPSNAQQRLIDKFHRENTYLICLRGRQLLGMVAMRDQRPFSLDAKLEQLDAYLPPHRSLCEVRLLAVDNAYRSPRVFQGLVRLAAEYGERQSYDLAVISGTVRQAKLYRQGGFVPFGPLVGAGAAQFQPMYLTLTAFEKMKQRAIPFRHSQSPMAVSEPQLLRDANG